MEFDIDDDLIDDACELEQDQHGDAEHLFPDDPDFSSEPAAARSTFTQSLNQSADASSLAAQGRSLLQAGGGAHRLDTLTPAPGNTTPHVNTVQVRPSDVSQVLCLMSAVRDPT